jgi:hypothetical protein
VLRCFSLAFAGLLVVFSLLRFATRRLLAGVGSRVAAKPSFGRRRQGGEFEPKKLWASDEFGFDHALQAYEDLIDAHVSTPRTPALRATCPGRPRWSSK